MKKYDIIEELRSDRYLLRNIHETYSLHIDAAYEIEHLRGVLRGIASGKVLVDNELIFFNRESMMAVAQEAIE